MQTFQNVMPTFRSWKKSFVHEVTMHKEKHTESLSFVKMECLLYFSFSWFINISSFK
jgi:hypothetical protein